MGCLPFDVTAAKIFELKKFELVSTTSLFAAIALSVSGVLVTRDIVNFQRVPNLQIEDWTK